MVDEFDIFRTSISPDDAETPSRVDPDAVVPTTIADKPLQSVAGRDPEVLDIFRRMDQFELPQGSSLHHPINTLDVLLTPDALGVFAAERSDHETEI
jgi:hypothetical protein